MANILTLVVDNPDLLLNAGAYGAGAVIQVQSSPDNVTFTDDGTVSIVAGTTSYTYYDTDGTSSTYYRTRYENVGETVTSEWSASFQTDTASANARYVTAGLLKQRLGLSGAANDALFDQICDETNQWIESYTGRVLGPVASATYTFDGGGNFTPDAYTLDLFRLGVRSVSLLETTTATGGSYTTVPTTDYYIRPVGRLGGEPGTAIVLSNGRFYSGYDTIRVTMEAGFAAVPDDVRAVAIAVATRAWHGRQTGMADVIANDTISDRAIVTKIVPPEMKATLDRYKPVLVR